MQNNIINNGIEYPLVEFTKNDLELAGGYLEVKSSNDFNFDNSTEFYIDLLIKFNYDNISQSNNPIFFRVQDEGISITGLNAGFSLLIDNLNNLNFYINNGTNNEVVTWPNFFGVNPYPDLKKWKRISIWKISNKLFLSVDGQNSVSQNILQVYNVSLISNLEIIKKGLTIGTSSNMQKSKIMKFYFSKDLAIKIKCDFKYGFGNYVIDESGNNNHLMLKNSANWNTTIENRDFYFNNIQPV